MAQERNRERKSGGMTTKQKATIGALVFIVLIIIWQVMGLFGGDSAPSAPATPPQPTASLSATSPGGPANTPPGNTPANTPPGAISPGPSVSPPTSPAVIDMSRDQPLRQMPITIENKMLEAQKNAEEKYIDQLNQLQALKIQKDIAEMNQAIASARLATVTAEKSVSDLLTKPTNPQPPPPPPQPTPPAVYSNALVNPTVEGAPLTNPEGGPPTQPPAPVPVEVSYTVISVSKQLGRWSAVLGNKGKLYSVGIGDVLPEDGSIVSSINKNGVTLTDKKGKPRRVGILTSI